jgi:hypothetical protein
MDAAGHRGALPVQLPRLTHDGAHATGDQICFDNALDRESSVGRVGASETARARFHTWLAQSAKSAHAGQSLQLNMIDHHRVEQSAED